MAQKITDKTKEAPDSELVKLSKEFLSCKIKTKQDTISLKYARRFEDVFEVTPVDMQSMSKVYIRVIDLEVSTKEELICYRGKRICGCQRKSLENVGMRCLHPAGFNTGHKGRGRCKRHDNAPTKAVTVLNGMAKEGLALEMQETFDLYPEMLSETALSSLNEEILIARFMLSKMIQAGGLAVASIPSQLDLIGKLKVQKSRIEVDKLLLDPAGLKLFVKSIFEIARETLSVEMYSLLAIAYKDKLKFPINEAGKQYLSEAKETQFTEIQQGTENVKTNNGKPDTRRSKEKQKSMDVGVQKKTKKRTTKKDSKKKSGRKTGGVSKG